MLKHKQNKKAQGLVEIFSGFLILLFAVIFFIFLNLPSCSGPPQQKLTGKDLADLKMNSDLIAYLRTPVDYSGSEITVADLIVLSIENESMKNLMIYPTGFIDLTDSRGVEYAFDSFFLLSEKNPLSKASAQLMKSYSGFIPAAANKGLFCSFRMYAKRGAEEINLLDSRFSWYDMLACGYEYVLARTDIPDANGNSIAVSIVGTVDTKKMLSVLGVTAVNPAAGYLLADYLEII